MSAPKILITTPVYGAPDSASVSVAYHEALLSMAQSGQIQLTPHMQWIGEDLVRVRCRALRFFLEETDCTHLLFGTLTSAAQILQARGRAARSR